MNQQHVRQIESRFKQTYGKYLDFRPSLKELEDTYAVLTTADTRKLKTLKHNKVAYRLYYLIEESDEVDIVDTLVSWLDHCLALIRWLERQHVVLVTPQARRTFFEETEEFTIKKDYFDKLQITNFITYEENAPEYKQKFKVNQGRLPKYVLFEVNKREALPNKKIAGTFFPESNRRTCKHYYEIKYFIEENDITRMHKSPFRKDSGVVKIDADNEVAIKNPHANGDVRLIYQILFVCMAIAKKDLNKKGRTYGLEFAGDLSKENKQQRKQKRRLSLSCFKRQSYTTACEKLETQACEKLETQEFAENFSTSLRKKNI